MSEDISVSSEERPHWAAIFALSVGVGGLIMAELLPVSLLTPMAADLRVSEGLAGQAITATSLAALIASLLVASATRRIDRRILLLVLTCLQIASNLAVAFAPTYEVLLLGRLLLGVSLGGFWALSTSLAMRLVPLSQVPKALSIIFGSVSIATIVAAPLGSFLGGMIGWRGVFGFAAALSALALVSQFAALPKMPPQGQSKLSTVLKLLARRRVAFGMAGVMLVFGGHFTFYTYLRPFLETVTGLAVVGITLALIAYGVGNFIGTGLSGPLLSRHLRLTLGLAPLLMAGLAAALICFGAQVIAVAALLALWGLAFGTVPIGWATWLTRAVPDEAESAGGLHVAAIQLSIGLGAALGGVAFDLGGPYAAFASAGVALLLAVPLALICAKGLGGGARPTETENPANLSLEPQLRTGV